MENFYLDLDWNFEFLNGEPEAQMGRQGGKFDFSRNNRIRYFEISPRLNSTLAVFPGDTPFQQNVLMDNRKGDHLTLSSIQSTLHIGAHTDAPLHYHSQGVDMADRSLNYYMGSCLVVEINCQDSLCIDCEMFKKSVPSQALLPKRILFKTKTFPDPSKWLNDFAYIAPELITYLGEKGVNLIGIDTPSIDSSQSKGLDAHQEVYRLNLAILEGLDLAQVPQGFYLLLCLPLRIEGADASPVRAILLSSNSVP